MRDAPDHNADSADGSHNPPRKRPVWPEIFTGKSAKAELSERERDLERREREFADWRGAHESKVAAIQAELGDRLNRCEELIADLEQEQTALEGERAQLQTREKSLRQTLLEELELEFKKLDAERGGLQAEKQAFRERLDASERELSTASDGLRQRWDTEREALRKQLTDKLAAEFSEKCDAFEAERAQWDAQRERELAALEEERAKHEDLLAHAQSGLEEIRQAQEREFQERRGALEEEISSRVEALQANLAQQQADWDASRGEAEAELLALREELEARRLAQDEVLETARVEFEQTRESQLRRLDEEAHTRLTAFEEERAAWIAERDADQARLDAEAAALEELQQTFEEQCAERIAALELEFEERRAEIDHELTVKQDAFDKECDSIRRALEEERAAMENRLHFQQDHLDRTRDDLEEARREIDLRVQQGRSQAAGLAETARLRRRQLDRYRDLLEQKDQSLERERRSLAEMQAEIESNRAADLEHQQRQANIALEARDEENLAQQELREDLVGRAKQLAERQARLDTLRVEIESTHRENLELRAALDEAWARLTQAVGPEIAKGEFVASRELVSEYFQKRETALEQRRALLTSESAAARAQVDQLDARRKELADWVAGNVATLQRREAELQRWASTLEARDSRMRDNAHRWQDEKLEAEGIIRGLLEQLAETTEDTPRLTMNTPATLPAEVPNPRRAAG